MAISRNGSSNILVLYFDSKIYVINSMFCTLAKYQKWVFQAWWVQSNIKTSIYHQYLISLKNPHELRWILIRVPAHTENLCEVKKKRSLGGTSNSHNPQLTRTSAQSEAALKVRGDASTYINHERSHHKKNSNAHKRHSASVCKHFFFCFLQRHPSHFPS